MRWMRNRSLRFPRTAVDPETLQAKDVPSLSPTGENLVEPVSLVAVTALVIAKAVMVRDSGLGICYIKA
jgi:hypothetical protein